VNAPLTVISNSSLTENTHTTTQAALLCTTTDTKLNLYRFIIYMYRFLTSPNMTQISRDTAEIKC